MHIIKRIQILKRMHIVKQKKTWLCQWATHPSQHTYRCYVMMWMRIRVHIVDAHTRTHCNVIMWMRIRVHIVDAHTRTHCTVIMWMRIRVHIVDAHTRTHCTVFMWMHIQVHIVTWLCECAYAYTLWYDYVSVSTGFFDMHTHETHPKKHHV